MEKHLFKVKVHRGPHRWIVVLILPAVGAAELPVQVALSGPLSYDQAIELRDAKTNEIRLMLKRWADL